MQLTSVFYNVLNKVYGFRLVYGYGGGYARRHNKRMNPTSSGDQALLAAVLRRLSLAGYARPR